MSKRVGRFLDPRYLIRVGAVALAYYALAKLALEPPFVGEVGRIVWPSSGLALAALLAGGVRLWPGIMLAEFAATQTTTGPFLFSLAAAGGNTLEIITACLLLDRLGFQARMERVRDIGALVGCASAGTIVSATIGVTGMYLGDVAPASAVPRIWWMWMLGHGMGMVVLTPFLLALTRLPRLRSARALEGGALMGLLVAVSVLSFGPVSGIAGNYPLEYLPFPLLIWAAFRFGPPGATVANLIVSGVAFWGIAQGTGPFALGSIEKNLLLTWVFVNVAAVTTLLLAAVVSERHNADRARRRSERQYRILIEQASDGIFTFDAAGRCLDVNTSGSELVGYAREELIGMSLEELVDIRDDASSQDDLARLELGHRVVASWTVRHRDGRRFPTEVSAKRLDDGRLQAFVRDVTERRLLEEQLHQSQKMEAVGRLAGGIAHDFNNLLTVILSHSDAAAPQTRERLRTDMREVNKAAERAADLTKQLLAFARKQIVEPEVLVLDELVERLENMLRRLLGEDIEFVFLSSAEPWPVEVDPVQLERVILNLAINARDAMPKGGRFVVETDNRYWLDPSKPDGLGLEIPPGSYASLTFRDTGVGMDADTLSRVFEPFYSTKEQANGTGLGLAVSYGLIKQAGGHIWATSNLGQGTRFHILLPKTEREPRPRSDSDEVATRVAPGGETVLLIEDEPLVRDLVEEILRERSHHVLVASNGEEALALADQYPGKIHLTLTDVVLPSMSGTEVARELKKKRPSIKVLFMSGYAEEQIVHHGVVDEGVAFLAKPFTSAKLTSMVRFVLDEDKRAAPNHPVSSGQETAGGR